MSLENGSDTPYQCFSCMSNILAATVLVLSIFHCSNHDHKNIEF